ncbi:hypothetical protein [Gordonibacter massiliensis (ex Traore et al. 2017)]|uniref:hypothetical protein n=1 Tax=Gordonibacter massiliensis (ex Traore et al. 2017) TaxID=1841863 RepID=UPI001C8C5512|nr:hypothetical protein [Gordonibacter massiliensis (ex Traore et al. 2017)]MBX9035028.1 hypothetical protein [Gordonibacter massiliensis (ex Traore et al. 2017)]
MRDDIEIDGVWLVEYGVVLSSVMISEPEPKTYMVDIPGGDGSIDLTDSVSGGAVYKNRKLEFGLAVRGNDWQGTALRLRNAYHGRRVALRCSWDKDHTYFGRVALDTSKSSKRRGSVKLTVDADPYKLRETRTYRVNSAGGVAVTLESGRKPVRPTVEVERRALVSQGGRTWEVGPGSWELDGLVLRQGANRVTINTYPEYSHETWAAYRGEAWASLAGKLLSHVAAGGKPLQDPDPLSNYAGRPWEAMRGRTWLSMSHPASPGDEFGAYVQYKWYDL